ncbi:MAG: hypothetical protein Q4F83_01875 [Eubacteriales bacterium]|nr:hypothetical protein [Eubacteriales bacterium]
MRFDRVYETLQLIEQKEGITMQDALDVFYDLYEDVKSENGAVLEQQPVGEPEEAVSRLCWMARMLARLFEKNQAELGIPAYEERLERARERMEKARVMLQETEEKEKERLECEQQIQEWEKKKAEAQRMLAQAEERNRVACEQYRQIVRQERELAEAAGNREEQMAQKTREYEAQLQEDQKRQEELAYALADLESGQRELKKKAEFLAGLWKTYSRDKVLEESWEMDNNFVKDLRREMESRAEQMKRELAEEEDCYRELIKLTEKGGYVK